MGKIPRFDESLIYGFTQLVDYCCATDLDLILAGDVLDKTKPDPTTVYVMRRQLDRMERQNLAVYFVQGQHELDRTNPWLNAISWWPEHINRKTIELPGGIKVYGIDWTPADQILNELNSIPPNTDILVAHQVWKDFMGPRIGESECSFSDVPHVGTIITGDFHRHLDLIVTNRQLEQLCVLSPGPVCMQSIDESPTKKFYVINDDLTFFSCPLRSRQCFRFELNDKEDLEAFLKNHAERLWLPQEDVPIDIAKNIVHITYQETIPDAYARITNAIGTGAHLFMVPVRQKPTQILIETERRRALAASGMEACLELVVAPDKALYKDLLSLLKSPTPLEQIVSIKTNFLKSKHTHD